MQMSGKLLDLQQSDVLSGQIPVPRITPLITSNWTLTLIPLRRYSFESLDLLLQKQRSPSSKDMGFYDTEIRVKDKKKVVRNHFFGEAETSSQKCLRSWSSSSVASLPLSGPHPTHKKTSTALFFF